MILSITEIAGFDKELLPKEEQDDIVVFDNNTKLDSDVASLLTLNGDVIDLSILPDRQYATNMQSLAYELAAYLDLELKDLPEFRAKYSSKEEIKLTLGKRATGLAATKIVTGKGETPQ
jgi:phenylalanyl-tRNA synthetase beta subunit